MQEPEAKPEEQRPEPGTVCYCPVCGGMHEMPWRPMGMRHMRRMGMWPMGMMPMGMWFMGAMPALMGFVVGFLVGSARSR